MFASLLPADKQQTERWAGQGVKGGTGGLGVPSTASTQIQGSGNPTTMPFFFGEFITQA